MNMAIKIGIHAANVRPAVGSKVAIGRASLVANNLEEVAMITAIVEAIRDKGMHCNQLRLAIHRRAGQVLEDFKTRGLEFKAKPPRLGEKEIQ